MYRTSQNITKRHKNLSCISETLPRICFSRSFCRAATIVCCCVVERASERFCCSKICSIDRRATISYRPQIQTKKRYSVKPMARRVLTLVNVNARGFFFVSFFFFARWRMASLYVHSIVQQ